MSAQLAVVRALVGRALNEITRVPGAAIPGVLAPAIFFLGLTSVFSKAAELPGFTAGGGRVDFKEFIVAVGLLQGAGFTGAATGVNLARDIEQGWFDRLLLCPVPRLALLAGIVLSAAVRCLIPMTFLLGIALAVGVNFPGVDGVLITAVLGMGLATAMACWGVVIAVRFRTQQAAPLMQVANFIAVLFTTSYAPRDLLQPWLRTVSDINPVTQVLEGVRQGFVGDVTWAETWPALLAVAGLLAVLGTLATRGLRRFGY